MNLFRNNRCGTQTICPACLIFVTDATIRPSVTSANESWINSGLSFVGYGMNGEEAKDIHEIVPCPPDEVYRNRMTNITQLDSSFKVGLCIRAIHAIRNAIPISDM